MKKNYNIIGLMLAAIVCLTGCEKDGNSTMSNENYIYQPQYEALEGIDGIVNGIVDNGRELYFNMWSNGIDLNSKEKYILKYNIDTKEHQKISLNLDKKDNIKSFRINEDGTITIAIYRMDGFNLTGFFLNQYDGQGELLKENELTETVVKNEGENTFVNFAEIDSQGNVYICYDNSDINPSSTIKGISQSGEEFFDINISGYVKGFELTGDETLYIAYQDLFGSMDIATLDIKTKDVTKLLRNLQGNDYSTFFAVDQNKDKLFFNSAGEMYEYDFASGKKNKIFGFTDMKIDESYGCNILQIDENTLCTVISEYDEVNSTTKKQLVYINKVRSEDGMAMVPEKKVLTLAVSFMDSYSNSVKEAVYDFNKKSDTHRVEIKVYGSIDLDDGMNLLQADIAAGNAPDIIDVSMVDCGNFIRKGILTDLAPFMEADTEISVEDFEERALELYRSDGKLYAIPIEFTLESLVGRTSDLNGMTGWTLEEYKTFVLSQADSQKKIADVSKEQMFNGLMMTYAGTFIDWNAGSCSFDSQEFIDILEFANTFPSASELDIEENEEIDFDKYLLYPLTVNSVLAYQMHQARFGTPVTFIGYPTENNQGTRMVLNSNVYGISEACEDKEEAWELLKILCTNKNVMYEAFPVYKPNLELQFEDAMQAYYTTDENGNQVEMVKMPAQFGDEVYNIYAAKPEEIQLIRDLIDGAERADKGSPGIYNILEEEAGAYFSGQKGAKEVVDVIQSRVNLYISENK